MPGTGVRGQPVTIGMRMRVDRTSGPLSGPKFPIPYMTRRLRADFDDSGELFFVNITTGGYGLRVSAATTVPTTYWLLSTHR